MSSESNVVTFNVELPGARRTHELKFKLGDTVRERDGCIKVKTAVDGDGNDMNVWVVMKDTLEGHEDCEEIRQKLNNEIGILKLMDHRHVLKLFQVFASDDRTYVLTERANVTLSQVLEQNGGKLDPQEAGTLFNQLLSAVAYIHSKGLCHRNIHPSAILFDDAKSAIRLTEFQHACLQGSRDLLEARPADLNPAFTAPELRAGVDGAYHGKQADVYSVVCVLYYMLTGKDPPLDGLKAAYDGLPDPVCELINNALTPEWKRVEGSGRVGIEDIKNNAWVCANRRHTSSADLKQQVVDAQMLLKASHEASGVGFSRDQPVSHQPARRTSGGGLGALSVAVAGNTQDEAMSSPESLCDDTFSPLPNRGPRVFGEMIPEKAAQLTVDSLDPTPFDLSPPASPSMKSKRALKLNTLGGDGHGMQR
eukprot:TRINITY_DN8448_c0_g1_i5.p1 TRINITY_DN8448_c0_g1~~TRINITY_DN8448_c0_g1_i5.p1  ORF type:complete len:422 (+),score=102.72 TRINITY_DN8448_c0_g1_i5:167-1432(+)